MLKDESILPRYIEFYKENNMRFFLVSLFLVSLLNGDNLSIKDMDMYEQIKKDKSLKDAFYVSVGTKDILYNVKSEGIIFSIEDSQEEALILTSFKDGYLNRFKLYFSYEIKDNLFHLDKVYFLSFNESCEHELNAIYEVKNKDFNNLTLNKFNSKKIHNLLYEKPIWINEKAHLTKLVSREFLHTYKDIFKLYKTNKSLFKKEIGFLLDRECSKKYYLSEKYLFLNNIELSNNLAFFFDQAGYHKEAIYLLEKILKKYPNRTVAYYNLGDAYWALGDKKKARKAYTTYTEQMCDAGKQKRIPKVVIDRITIKGNLCQ